MEAKLIDSVKVPLVPYVFEGEETKNHIRSSTLLLTGRILALVINLGTQILLVRYLSKTGYGAFAYAMAIVSLGSTVAVFGMEKSVGRFVAIYREQQDHPKVLGTIILMVATILALGLALVLLVIGFQGWMYGRLVKDPQAMAMLVVLIALSPIQALEAFFIGLLSSFAKSRAIFFRKHLLGPGLCFLAVLVLTLIGSTTDLIAAAYLAAGMIGVGISVVVLVRMLRQMGILNRAALRKIELPWREVYSFTTPLLVSDLVFVLRTQFIVVLLEYFRSTTEVADYRAVFPIARSNMVVYQNFVILFIPLASRMFARKDLDGMNALYQKTAIWIAVISFPLLAISSALAKPLTTVLFGERYQEAAPILMILSLGFYFSAALGFNGHTLRVIGKVRYMFKSDLMTAIFGVGICLLLIPRYGALGGAIAFSSTLVVQNICYQLGLLYNTEVGRISRTQLKVYAIIALCWSGLLILPDYSLSLMVAAIVSFLVVRLNRRSLDIERTFPELFRIPLMRRIFGN